LIARGEKAILADLLRSLELRDEQDKTRQSAPLKPAEDALQLDNSAQTIEDSVDTVLNWWQDRRPF
jgi:3-phosphoshikimate 1-carboxyvinyltransferase